MEMKWQFISVLVTLLYSMASLEAMSITNNLTDLSALLAFKAHITLDPQNVLATWSSATHFCNWFGVTCGNNSPAGQHPRVTALNLPDMGLYGTVPSHLGNLSVLEFLSLGDNRLTGPVPSTIFNNMSSLQFVDLSFNKLSGSLPADMCYNVPLLKTIYLSSNLLSGQIPSSLYKCKALESLSMFDNPFTGSMSREIGNLTMLKLLLLKNTNMSGEIPVEIGNLHGLGILSLAASGLTGRIPSAIFKISSLQGMDLSENYLSGNLPEDMCYHLPNLTGLHLHENQLQGPLPPSLGMCRKLQIISLSYNEFSGSMPSEIGNLTMLRSLYLGSNKLIGSIPKELGSLQNLEKVAVEANRLTGPIPPGVFNISSLKSLRLLRNSLSDSLPPDMCHGLPVLEELNFDNNNIMGNLPRDIGNCTFLKIFIIQKNYLTGGIPEEIGNLQYMEKLALSLNSLTGYIPSSIFNSSSLRIISLAGNQLSGNLQQSFGRWLPNIEEVYLGSCNLSGTFPSSISNASKLIVLDLGWNSLTGFIPMNLGSSLQFLQALSLQSNYLTSEPFKNLGFLDSLTNCRNLIQLGIGNNPLDGFLPISIGNLSTSLQTFSANDGELKGGIPQEIGNLRNLRDLDLSYNNFTGSIPSTVGRLPNLQRLYVMNNSLQGSIPIEFCYLRRIGVMAFSGNGISGSIPPCLGSLSTLRDLFLDSNKLTSEIPSTLWGLKDLLVLNLSYNSLSGSLPLEVGQLKVLLALYLSGNNLSGNIPSTIGGMQSLLNLSLAHNKLQGQIPGGFGELKGLEFLDLSYNNLSGVIPTSMEGLLYLAYLNLSSNQLHGRIPSGGPFANFTEQSFMSNDALCGLAPSFPTCKNDNAPRSNKAKLKIFRYILPSVVLAMLILIAAIQIRVRKKNRQSPNQKGSLPLIASHRKISYQELLAGTSKFDEGNLLGMGSFGRVYKCVLSDGINVAVKVFNLQVEGAFRSFEAECEIMRNIRHRNLLKIICSCSNTVDFMALVLEYMPNGSLEKWVHSESSGLTLIQRLNIMIDVASAIEYLHYGYPSPVLHCDLKPSNVLLNEEMVAHVGDFGIGKLLDGNDHSMTQTKTLATIGYMSPEYGMEGLVSTRGDVYSYGILLMETFTGKKPTNEMFVGEMSLKSWVSKSLPHSVAEVIQACLFAGEGPDFSGEVDCLASIMELAVACTADSPEARINMRDALTRLEKIKEKCLLDVT